MLKVGALRERWGVGSVRCNADSHTAAIRAPQSPSEHCSHHQSSRQLARRLLSQALLHPSCSQVASAKGYRPQTPVAKQLATARTADQMAALARSLCGELLQALANSNTLNLRCFAPDNAQAA